MELVTYVGIDVDDEAFHGCGIIEGRPEKRVEFRCKPSVGALLKKLKVFMDLGQPVKLCYEATYLGFSLQRALALKGVLCEVVAPSSIPRRVGKAVKTDKVDCRELAEYYQKGLLSIVHIPDEKEESIRDLIRSRKFQKEQVNDLKRHILALCRRHKLDYRESRGSKKAAYWTKSHLNWLEAELGRLTERALEFNLKILLSQLHQMESSVAVYDEEILRIAEAPLYRKKVAALNCYRGIDTLTSMTLITELGDIQRFDHPRRLTSYAGLDLREYSSGGRHRRYQLSKMGNYRIRTSAVEACQMASRIPQLSVRLKEKRKGVDPKLVEIADRCMKRLHKKSSRLLYAGKPVNKVKVACARELLGFVWESLRAAA
ncbi:MAG: IS110 family transposase [Bradymonadales bacterium]|nr:MAG: IS110 family transposase [Bradymonadales bacterium]